MGKWDATKIPYGISDFARIRREGYYYVDKTGYVPTVESAGSFLFFVRPRRFGKSLFVDMLRCYYDLNEKANFEKSCGDLAIGREPTPNRNKYLVLALDFSKVSGGDLSAQERNFDEYMCKRLDAFAMRYPDVFAPDFV